MRVQEPAAEYVVDKKGHKKSVLLSVDQYERLMEDLHDLVAIAERKNEKAVPFDQVRRALKKNGRL